MISRILKSVAANVERARGCLQARLDQESQCHTDTLGRLWDDQAAFMQLLIEKRQFPSFPLDITQKESQRFIKSIIQDTTGELHEAISELRNSKRHRASEVQHFDRDAYVEELVDAQKFLLEVLILSGISMEEFTEAYFRKSRKNVDRINGGY